MFEKYTNYSLVHLIRNTLLNLRYIMNAEEYTYIALKIIENRKVLQKYDTTTKI